MSLLVRWSHLLLFCSLFVFTNTSAQVPVIPGAAGFGMDTPAGRGGAVIKVTNLNENGPGSLRACIDASGPRVCVFEVSGIIQFTTRYYLDINNPYLTIAGQTAPSPGITLGGIAGLAVRASDVLIQHIAIRGGDAPHLREVAGSTYAAMVLSDDVVFDHVSLSWAMDQIWNTWAGYGDVTIRNSIISEPLFDSYHPQGSEGYNVLIGPSSVGRVAMIGNLIAHGSARLPVTQSADFILANNVIYNWKYNGATDLDDWGYGPVRRSVIGNVYLPGVDTPTSAKPIWLNRRQGSGSQATTQVYLAGNDWVGRNLSDQWEMVSSNLSFSPRVNSAPVWIAGLPELSAFNTDVVDMVLDNVGSRPAERDSVDSRVVNGVRNGTGQIINCVSPDGSTRCQKNGGGWPPLAENYRALTIPSNPNGDSDNDGYTNLEEWLHDFSRTVEGSGQQARPKPPVLIEPS